MSSFQFYEDAAKEWRWRLKDGNHKIVADSGEGYKEKAECQKAAGLFTALGPDAPVREAGEPSNNSAEWEYYKDRKGEWRWRFLVKGNADKQLADSSEGYESEYNVKRAIANVKDLLRKEDQQGSGNSGGGNSGGGSGSGGTSGGGTPGGGYQPPTSGGSNVPPRFA